MSPKVATAPASFQLIMAVGGTQSYACYIYGTVPAATAVPNYTAPPDGTAPAQNGVPMRVCS